MREFYFSMENDFVKITDAVYKVLDFLPEDPLKTAAKDQALLVLKGLTQQKAATGLLQDIEVLENYLKLAKYRGWLADMNFFIITGQYRRIAASLQKHAPASKPQTANNSSAQPSKPKKTKKPEEKLTGRQLQIIKILKQRQKAQVAQLMEELPDITKRTVRRDLDDLLKKGKIARVGQFNQVFYQIA